MQETRTGQLIFLLCKCSAEILRHRRQETHRLPGDRVGKFQLEGMQGLGVRSGQKPDDTENPQAVDSRYTSYAPGSDGSSLYPDAAPQEHIRC